MEEHLPVYDGCKTPPADGSEGEAAAEQESEQSDDSEARAQSDSENDSEHDSDDDEKGNGYRRKRRFAHRRRRNWTALASFDRTAMLDSEIDAAISALATEKMQESGLMEWPEIKRADQKKTIGLWVRNEEHWKQRGSTHVETYYFPLRNRCGCRVQLRITRAPSVYWNGLAVRIRTNCVIPRMLQKI